MSLSGQDSTRRRSRPYDWDESDLQQRMPPGATGSRPPRASGSTTPASSHSNNHSRATLDALLNAPTRESQPHLHLAKINGALWFGVDPSVHKFIRTTWQGYFMGPWKNWTEVPDERKDNWWFTFIQNYYWEKRFHETVYYHWKQQTMKSVGERISKKKRANKKPKYISEDDWITLMEYWDTEPAIRKSISAAKSRLSNTYGKGVHKHCAGPRPFLQVEHQMMVESGSDQPPAFIDLVKKTHMRKDGTYVDPRAESLVTEVEEVATQLTAEDGSPNGLSQTASSAPSRILLNKEYVKRGKTKRGHIYGIGSVQFRDIAPSETVSASLNRNLDMEMRISSLEDKFKTVNDNVEVVKEDLVALKAELKAELKADLKAGLDSMKDEMSESRVALKAIMLALGINLQQQVTQTQPSVPIATNPTVSSTTVPINTSTPPTTTPVLSPSVPNDANGPASPATNNAYLDKWCKSLGI